MLTETLQQQSGGTPEEEARSRRAGGVDREEFEALKDKYEDLKERYVAKREELRRAQEEVRAFFVFFSALLAFSPSWQPPVPARLLGTYSTGECAAALPL